MSAPAAASTNSNPAECFSAFCKLLQFVVDREIAASRNPPAAAQLNDSVAWFEAVSTSRAVESSLVSSGAAIGFVKERSGVSGDGDGGVSFELVTLVGSGASSPPSLSSSCVNDTIRAAAVEEQRHMEGGADARPRPADRTVAIIFEESFARGAVSHADGLMRGIMMAARASPPQQTQQQQPEPALSAGEQRQMRDRISLVRLFAAPNNYQAWSWRKQLLVDEVHTATAATAMSVGAFMPAWWREMHVNALIFSRLAKSPDSWTHRIWLMQQLFHFYENNNKNTTTATAAAVASEAASSSSSTAQQQQQPNDDHLRPTLSFLIRLVATESQRFAARACAVYKRGYPAWEYRRAVWGMLAGAFTGSKDAGSEDAARPRHLMQSALADELNSLLGWIEGNPSDASAVTAFIDRFHVARSCLGGDDEVLASILHRAWLQSQRMLRTHSFITPVAYAAADGEKAGSGSRRARFIVPNLSHEAIWLLRRGVVQLSTTPAFNQQPPSSSSSSSQHLYRGWTVEDELAFVDAFVASHELAVALHSQEQQQQQGATQAREEVVRMKLSADDVAQADHGEFAALHALRYGIWLLRR
jgi:hypothetical protein